ncbi:hypothetical protein ACFP9V_07485 [Deinococcus radiopugnans]|uniref:hypothetical protein n=1 Tax=Deinococcus radiopugnans TaxID=57497 RepID=UPI00360C48FE
MPQPLCELFRQHAHGLARLRRVQRRRQRTDALRGQTAQAGAAQTVGGPALNQLGRGRLQRAGRVRQARPGDLVPGLGGGVQGVRLQAGQDGETSTVTLAPASCAAPSTRSSCGAS